MVKVIIHLLNPIIGNSTWIPCDRFVTVDSCWYGYQGQLAFWAHRPWICAIHMAANRLCAYTLAYVSENMHIWLFLVILLWLFHQLVVELCDRFALITGPKRRVISQVSLENRLRIENGLRIERCSMLYITITIAVQERCISPKECLPLFASSVLYRVEDVCRCRADTLCHDNVIKGDAFRITCLFVGTKQRLIASQGASNLELWLIVLSPWRMCWKNRRVVGDLMYHDHQLRLQIRIETYIYHLTCLRMFLALCKHLPWHTQLNYSIRSSIWI